MFVARVAASSTLGRMNPDVAMLVADAERALRDGDHQLALTLFIEAGDCAAQYGLWRSAMRLYRHGLELDIADPRAVTHAARIAYRLSHQLSGDWIAYATALERHRWPRFGCRDAQTVIADRGSYALCPSVGPVLAITIGDDDVVAAKPFGRFSGMPLAMAMIILRRALFANPRDFAESPQVMQLTFAERRVALDELGEWQPA